MRLGLIVLLIALLAAVPGSADAAGELGPRAYAQAVVGLLDRATTAMAGLEAIHDGGAQAFIEAGRYGETWEMAIECLAELAAIDREARALRVTPELAGAHADFTEATGYLSLMAYEYMRALVYSGDGDLVSAIEAMEAIVAAGDCYMAALGRFTDSLTPLIGEAG